MGSSAGGVGVLNNTDAVQSRLPASARFVALMDAGFFKHRVSHHPRAGAVDHGDGVGRPRRCEL
jgi:hypothetical protein